MKFLNPTPQTAPNYVGEYKILNEIGFGSTGVVKLAEDQTGRRFAVKIIPSLNPHQRNEALREIEILNRLKHENIIQVEHFQDTKVTFLLAFSSFGRTSSRAFVFIIGS